LQKRPGVLLLHIWRNKWISTPSGDLLRTNADKLYRSSRQPTTIFLSTTLKPKTMYTETIQIGVSLLALTASIVSLIIAIKEHKKLKK